jgi:hypothetical protein
MLTVVALVAAALGLFNVVRSILAHGRISDLPASERQVLTAIEGLGIRVCDAFS